MSHNNPQQQNRGGTQPPPVRERPWDRKGQHRTNNNNQRYNSNNNNNNNNDKDNNNNNDNNPYLYQYPVVVHSIDQTTKCISTSSSAMSHGCTRNHTDTIAVRTCSRSTNTTSTDQKRSSKKFKGTTDPYDNDNKKNYDLVPDPDDLASKIVGTCTSFSDSQQHFPTTDDDNENMNSKKNHDHRDDHYHNHDNDIDSNNNNNNNNDDNDVPYVVLNQIRYYSDRFYLNRTVYDNDDDHDDDDDSDNNIKNATHVPTTGNSGRHSSRSTNTNSNQCCCTCGAKGSPPLFDTPAFIQTLELQAVIIGTYTFDISYLQKYYPTLFGSSSNRNDGDTSTKIPTLVLHGTKGWTYNHDHTDNNHQMSNDNDSDDHGSRADESDKTNELPVLFNPLKSNNNNLLQNFLKDESQGELSNSSWLHQQQEKYVIDKNNMMYNSSDDNDNSETENDIWSLLTQEQLPNPVAPLSSSVAAAVSLSPIKMSPPRRLFSAVTKTKQNENDHHDTILPRPPPAVVVHQTFHNRNYGSIESYPNTTPSSISHSFHHAYTTTTTTTTSDCHTATTTANKSNKKQHTTRSVSLLPRTVHFTEVQTRYIPPNQITMVTNDMKKRRRENNNISGTTTTLQQQDERENFNKNVNTTTTTKTINTNTTNTNTIPVELGIHRFGVHHPKYMLLFEKSGSLIVLITTANFTQPTTIDATWIQRFPPQSSSSSFNNNNYKNDISNNNKMQHSSTSTTEYFEKNTNPNFGKEQHGTNHSSGTTSGNTRSTKDDCEKHRTSYSNHTTLSLSDFGLVLTNFLYCTTFVTKKTNSNHHHQIITIQQFMKQYCQWNTIQNLYKNYDYSKAQVYLIPTVPGDHHSYDHHYHHHNHTNDMDQKKNQNQNQNQNDTSSHNKFSEPSSLLFPKNDSSATGKEEPSTIKKGNNKDHSTTRQHYFFLYGRQRVQAILDQLCNGNNNNDNNPSLPRELLSDHDRLILQPTSFGAEWNTHNMAQVLQSYWASSGTTKNHATTPRSIFVGGSGKRVSTNVLLSDQNLLERADIVWPTEQYVQHSKRKYRHQSRRRLKNGFVSSPLKKEEEIQHPKRKQFETTTCALMEDSAVKLDKKNEGCLFMSSDTFNSIDLLCLSQMVQYEPSYPNQMKCFDLIPHFKSICRLFNGNDYRLRQDHSNSSILPSYRNNTNDHHHHHHHTNNKAEEYISWFLLTSACLSRGAQGENKNTSTKKQNRSFSTYHHDDEVVSYSNFELGILFTSHLPKQQQTYHHRHKLHKSKQNNENHHNQHQRRLYCWKPTLCTCFTNKTRKNPTQNNTTTITKFIHLPIPYSLRPTRYQSNSINNDDDDDEADFDVTPYLHEIPPGTGCVGHMRLTPYGSNVADAYEKAGI